MFVHNELVVKYPKLNSSVQNLYLTKFIRAHSEPHTFTKRTTLLRVDEWTSRGLIWVSNVST